MKNLRSLSKEFLELESFYELSVHAKILYVYINSEADDDGFISSFRKALVASDSTIDNIKELIDKGFIYKFDSGVCVLLHWHKNNYIRNDRYKETMFKTEKSLLTYNSVNKIHFVNRKCKQLRNFKK